MLDFEAFKEEYQKVPVEEYPNRVVETMPEPMVSVHVSTYQHADFIHDCLEGVLMQETDFPVEIIIGEDESNDGTREICKEYADRYPEKIRLFLHRRENNISIHGQPTGRFQFMYSHFVARGRYLAICEGDDYWTDSSKLQKQVDFLEANEEYALVHHDACAVSSDGVEIRVSELPDKNKKNFTKEELMMGPYLLTMSLCLRGNIEKYPEDLVRVLNADKFIISLKGNMGRGKYMGEIENSKYRVHRGSMWSSLKKEKKQYALFNTFKVLKKYYEKRDEENLYTYFQEKCLLTKEHTFYSKIGEKRYLESIKCQVRAAHYGFVKVGFLRALRFILNSTRTVLGGLKRDVKSVFRKRTRD
jgi:glycosyltransferase involved in cell wall biosynthesis